MGVDRAAFRGICCTLAIMAIIVLAHVVKLPSATSATSATSSLRPRFRTLDGNDDDGPTCDHIGSQDDPCQYVKDNCDDVAVLIDYLNFRYCKLSDNNGTIALAYIVLFLWLGVIISLLASTADKHFVPCLQTLSDDLQLSKPVAGITLLALGNGAPDVFTAIAGLGADDFPLVLGALIGASMCISSFILGSVLLVPLRKPMQLDRRVFLRDIGVYITATLMIIVVCSDGVITIYESIAFLILYFFYVGLVVGLERWQRRKAAQEGQTHLLQNEVAEPTDGTIQSDRGEGEDEDDEPEKKPEYIAGLSAPEGVPWHKKLQYVVELPFSFLRWLSCPPADMVWGKRRRVWFIIMPTSIGYLLLLASEGWDGFTMEVNGFPITGIIAIIGGTLSVIIAATTNNDRIPPYYSLFTFLSFCSSIAWLNILANECVALLQTFGIMWDISTAVLGLTVLAIGNSVGDFVADTAVARAGHPETGVASCFGSPLLNDVVGLGLSLTITCAGQFPDNFYFTLNTQVIVGWIFLGSSLFGSLGVFVVTNYKPPRWWGTVLVPLYITFLIVTVVIAVV